MTHLSLGSAQLAQDYGVSNRTGTPSIKEASVIIEVARELGVTKIDTAPNYSSSENLLGQMGLEGFEVTSKIPSIAGGAGTIEDAVNKSVLDSLDRLKIDRLEGLLVHNPEEWTVFNSQSGRALVDRLKAEGVIKKFGVSIYHPEELDRDYKRGSIDIIQAPLNVFDTRLAKSGWMARLADDGVEIQVRSVFLQGLLLMERKDMHSYFDTWGEALDRWEKHKKDTKIDALAYCLAFVAGFSEVDTVIVGVQDHQQLKMLVKRFSGANDADHEDLSCQELGLIDPSRWELR